jgi:catechol 2,3-dioxygenase-like lactoylglutathione lyase family enzyme
MIEARDRFAWSCLLGAACLVPGAGCGSSNAPAGGNVSPGKLEGGASDAEVVPRPYGCTGAVDADGRPPICDVAHVAFRVTDLAKARGFYGAYLGFAEPFGVSDQVAVFKINDTQYIELHEEPAPEGDLNYQLKRLAFYTSDAASLRAYYEGKGVMVPAGVGKNALGNTSFTISDADGHVIEWIQYEPDSMTGKTQGQAMPSSRIGTAIHHIGVTIGDQARADAFYYDMLGLSPSSTADKHAARAPEGSDRIEYGTYHAAPTKEFAVVRDHLCLRVSSTDEAYALLTARDPAIVIERHLLENVTGRANVQDPDGSRIEMAESTPVPEGERAANGVVLHL